MIMDNYSLENRKMVPNEDDSYININELSHLFIENIGYESSHEEPNEWRNYSENETIYETEKHYLNKC